MLNSKRLKALVAPLDWGLGHATRCIPIIKGLTDQGYEVIVATDDQQKNLLQTEFPDLQFVDLPGYNIKYGKAGWSFGMRIILQIPKILIQINREGRWLKSFLRDNELDLLISDNRFGLYSPDIYSVFVTHQLYIRTGFGNLISKMLTRLNYKFINRFNICLVPDLAGKISLAGILSHPATLPVIPMRYLGPLSRFEILPAVVQNDSVVIIISGPEPSRSVFEKKIFDQARSYKGKLIILRGLPNSQEKTDMPPNILVYNHLPSTLLNKAICESAFVIARSGYSTIMDLVALGKKSILIPTPGQPEQEYLAASLFEKKIIYSAKEEDFVLENSLTEARKFSFSTEMKTDSLLSETIAEITVALKKR